MLSLPEITYSVTLNSYRGPTTHDHDAPFPHTIPIPPTLSHKRSTNVQEWIGLLKGSFRIALHYFIVYFFLSIAFLSMNFHSGNLLVTM